MKPGLFLLYGLLLCGFLTLNLLINGYVQNCLPTQKKRPALLLGLAFVNIVTLGVFLWLDLAIFFIYVIFTVLLAADYFFLLRTGFPSLLLLACGYGPFLLLCAHGVLIPLFALVRGTTMYDVVNDNLSYDVSLLLALLVCILLLCLIGKWMPYERIHLLFRCTDQRRLVCTCLYLLFGYLLLESYVYADRFSGIWIPWFHLITSVISMAAFLMVFWYAVDVSSYIEYELKTRQTEKQLQRQVVHYQQYTKYVNDLRAFKHDYRHMVQTARALLRAGADQKALDLLGQMDDEMESSLRYTRYANHVVVDAILQECAGRCREKGIDFSALVNLPERIGLGDLELCRIFGNLVDNAYEACEKCEAQNRFIKLDSVVSPDWITVQIRNTFSGKIELQDGLPLTDKQDPSQHGVGLSSTRQLIESTGGFMQIEIDPAGIFTVKLHFCAAPG